MGMMRATVRDGKEIEKSDRKKNKISKKALPVTWAVMVFPFFLIGVGSGYNKKKLSVFFSTLKPIEK